MKHKKNLKKKYLKAGMPLVLIALFTLLGVYALKSYFAPPSSTVLFEIAPGATGRQVAKELKATGLLRSETIFLAVLRLTVGADGLKAGKFVLNKGMNPVSLISCISSNRCQFLKKVTILEGQRIEETAEVLEKAQITHGDEFAALAREQNLEGYLFPSTYLFPEDISAQKVIDTMLEEFNRKVRPILPGPDYYMTENEILTLASIVEREAVLTREKPKIAAVYLNRLKIGMKLQADPTVQYAVGYDAREKRHWKKNLTLSDLRKTDSPYNTYMYAGLPPGPIASPSLTSVKAVLNPEPDFEALFFVADNQTGGHIFTNTYNHHVRAIRRIRGLR